MNPIPFIAPSERGVAYACAFVGSQTGIFGDGRSLKTFRSIPTCAQRRKVWAFIRAAWGWSFPDIARHTNARHTTVLTALKSHGMDSEFIENMRARLLSGEIQPARPDEAARLATVYELPPHPPPAPSVIAKPRKRRKTAQERRSERMASVGIIEEKPGVHASTCSCSVCCEIMTIARRLAARPNLQANDVDGMVRTAFIRARHELAVRGEIA